MIIGNTYFHQPKHKYNKPVLAPLFLILVLWHLPSLGKVLTVHKQKQCNYFLITLSRNNKQRCEDFLSKIKIVLNLCKALPSNTCFQ